MKPSIAAALDQASSEKTPSIWIAEPAGIASALAVGRAAGQACHVQMVPIHRLQDAAEHRDAQRAAQFAGQVVHRRPDPLLLGGQRVDERDLRHDERVCLY